MTAVLRDYDDSNKAYIRSARRAINKIKLHFDYTPIGGVAGTERTSESTSLRCVEETRVARSKLEFKISNR